MFWHSAAINILTPLLLDIILFNGLSDMIFLNCFMIWASIYIIYTHKVIYIKLVKCKNADQNLKLTSSNYRY